MPAVALHKAPGAGYSQPRCYPDTASPLAEDAHHACFPLSPRVQHNSHRCRRTVRRQTAGIHHSLPTTFACEHSGRERRCTFRCCRAGL